MSPALELAACGVARFPRVSGDEPKGERISARRREFSPRERG